MISLRELKTTFTGLDGQVELVQPGLHIHSFLNRMGNMRRNLLKYLKELTRRCLKN